MLVLTVIGAGCIVVRSTVKIGSNDSIIHKGISGVGFVTVVITRGG